MIFQEHEKGFKLELPNSDIRYFPAFLKPDEALFYFQRLRQLTPWRQDSIKVFGKEYPQPRLTALYGNNDRPYSYSGISMKPLEFNSDLLKLKALAEQKTSVEFTSCLLNLYRDGKDSNGWHADDEKELGKNPVIASLSLGQPRYFHLKHRKDKTRKSKLLLENGSLLLMQGETQHYWLHQVPKTAKKVGERINLTFRVIQ